MTTQTILEFIVFLLLPALIAGLYFPPLLVDLAQRRERNSKAILFWSILVLFLLFFPIFDVFTSTEPKLLRTEPVPLTGFAILGHLFVRQIIYRLRIRREKVLWNFGRGNQLISILLFSIVLLNGFSLLNSSFDAREPVLSLLTELLFVLSFTGFWAMNAFSHILVLENGIATAMGTLEWDKIEKYEWGSPHKGKVPLTVGNMTVKVPVSQQAEVDAFFQSHQLNRALKKPLPKPYWLKEPSPEWQEYQEKKKAIQDERPKMPLAPLTHRATALLLDVTIVLGPLFFISQIFFLVLAYQLGPYSRLLSYAILIAYLTFCNSSLSIGQTLGQRITKVAVVDRNYQLLSPGKALIRSTVLCLIVIFIGWELPLFDNWLVGAAAWAIAIGGIFALLYGWFSNGDTHQGIHELLTGSYVVKWPPITVAPLPKTPRKHWIATIGLFMLGVLLTSGAAAVLSRPEWQMGGTNGRDFTALEAALTDHDDIFSASIRETGRTVNDEKTRRDTLNVDLWIGQDCSYRSGSDGCTELMNEVARLVLEQHGLQSDYEKLTITVENKYDIGFPVEGITFSRTNFVSDWLQDLGLIGV